jgi:leucyl/phenylalanyl-tRNA--protein transferase
MQGLCRRDFASRFSEGTSAEPDQTPWATRRRRETLFRDCLPLWYDRQRASLSTSINLLRILGLVKFLKGVLQPRAELRTNGACPALDDRLGFCGIGGSLSAMPLMGAYARGLYPRFLFGAISWWSPPTRIGLLPCATTPSRDIAALLESGSFSFTFDRAFDRVLAACARSRRRAAGRPPPIRSVKAAASICITPVLMRAFATLHDLGFAHSFEVWNETDQLVGGGYGISVGRVFVCEGLLTWSNEATTVGLVTLNQHLCRWGYCFTDLGAHMPQSTGLPLTELGRGDYEHLLTDPFRAGQYARWRAAPGRPACAQKD